MIFELFAEEIVEYADDDYKIFEQEIISKYNMDYITDKMNEMLKNIKEVQYKFIGINKPKVTANYIMKYEQFTNNKSNPTFKAVVNRIETEEQLIEAYNRIKNVFQYSLSYAEKVIFIDFYIINRSRDIIKEKLRIGNDRYTLIRNSCLIKFALGLRWEEIENK